MHLKNNKCVNSLIEEKKVSEQSQPVKQKDFLIPGLQVFFCFCHWIWGWGENPERLGREKTPRHKNRNQKEER